MKLLQVVTDTDRRGAQVFAFELAPHLERAGVAVRTVALAPGSAAAALPVPTLGDRRLGLPTLRALRAEARASDVVLAHGSSTLPAGAVALAGTGVPLVYRQVSDPAAWAPGGFRRLRVRAYYRRVAGVLALGPGTAATLAERFGVDRDRITVVPNATSADRWPERRPGEQAAARRALGLPDEVPGGVVAVVGALAREKRVAWLLEALGAHPWPAGAAPAVLVAGDGPEAAAVRAAAQRVPLEVRCSGALDDPRPAYVAADVLALPSATESQPGVVLEAALVGVPAVASAVGEVGGLIDDQVSGWLVAPGPAGAFAAAVAAALADRPALAAAGAAARARTLAHGTLEQVAPRIVAVLEGHTRRR